MTRRFWQASLDSRILEASSQFELSLCRDDDGNLSGTFALSGGFGDLSGENAPEADDGLQLVADLLREFHRGQNGGQHA